MKQIFYFRDLLKANKNFKLPITLSQEKKNENFNTDTQAIN